jgi:hypothetical protein
MPDDGVSPVPAEESRHDRRRHRRVLFLEPKETYSFRDAAEILCMPLPDRKTRRHKPPFSGFCFSDF